MSEDVKGKGHGLEDGAMKLVGKRWLGRNCREVMKPYWLKS